MQKIIVTTDTEKRINAYLSSFGACSRREADHLIKTHKVLVNGKISTLGQKVKNSDIIEIRQENKSFVYFIYNKPRGEVTGEIEGYASIYPVGRLDKESEGLLLYTNDYTLVDALLNPKYANEKEYMVTVREKMTPRVKRLLEGGIVTQEGSYGAAKKVTIYDDAHTLAIILTEGKKHEIRRMLNALNLTIVSLRRVRFLFLRLSNLKQGDIRMLDEEEILKLKGLGGR